MSHGRRFRPRAFARSAARGTQCDRAGGRRRSWRSSGGSVCLALEARRPARPHCSPAAGLGFQRSSKSWRCPDRGGRTMSMPNVADNGDPISAAIDAAEEVRDPLDDLVETTTADPGAAFMPEVLERLAALRRDDRAAFESLRAQLKRAGCRVTALDQTINEESGEAGRGPTQADVLIDLAQTAELFHTPNG